MARKMSMAEKLASRVQPLPDEATVEAVAPTSPAESSDDMGEPSTAPAEAASAAPSEAAATARKSDRPRSAPAPRKRKSGSDAGRTSPTTLSAPAQLILELPESVNRRLTAYRVRTRKSHAFVLLKAVESTYDRLPELVKTALGEDDEPVAQLFERSARTATPVRTSDSEPTFTHSIRTTINNRTALSELAEELGAPSRNFLLVLAYDAFLPAE